MTPDGCRPITILSAFWRVWVSSWLKKCTSRAWLDAVLDPSIQYGGGCDAAVASAAVLEDYVNSGFLGTLDFSKCFDCLRPVASSRLLVACGVPPSLGSLICLMWTHHRRWVSWNGHVGSRPMSCGLALPQGDPLGPLVAALWLSAGARFVRRARLALRCDTFQFSWTIELGPLLVQRVCCRLRNAGLSGPNRSV